MTTSPDTGVIITGGASGIGWATAAALAEVGRPIAIWDIGSDRVGDAGAKLAASGASVAALEVDVTDHAAFDAAIDSSRQTMGSIGGLVHAAGNIIPEPIEEVDWTHWTSQIDVHLNAYRATRAGAPSRPAGPPRLRDRRYLVDQRARGQHGEPGLLRGEGGHPRLQPLVDREARA